MPNIKRRVKVAAIIKSPVNSIMLSEHALTQTCTSIPMLHDLCVCVQACMCACVQACLHACMPLCVCMCAGMPACLCVQVCVRGWGGGVTNLCSFVLFSACISVYVTVLYKQQVHRLQQSHPTLQRSCSVVLLLCVLAWTAATWKLSCSALAL